MVRLVELDLAAAVLVDLDQLLLTYVIAARQAVRLVVEAGGDIIDDADRRADGSSGSALAAPQPNARAAANNRAPDRRMAATS
ncbi:MAG: hypothetical protein WDN31_09480 [Hyphomicrobium sp.]